MLIALQDNFNIVLNKQEAKRQQQEATKIDDKIFEYKTLELLQKTILAKMEKLEKQTDVYNLMIKNEIVNDIIKDIQDGSILVNKNSKYKKEKQLKYLLLSNYERNAKKCLQLQKQKDKENETTTTTTTATITTTATTQKSDFKLLKILLLIIASPFIVLIGFIGAVCKNIE